MAGLTTFLARTGYHEGMDVIYADELVALNALIDYLLLVLSARAAELPVRRGRSALAGLLGGLYALAAAALPGWLRTAGAKLLVSLLMDRILKKDSLGGGDVKLLAVIGLYLGFLPTLFALILACFIGLGQAVASGRVHGKAFPFGPALSAAAALMLFFGAALSDWYLGLFL